MAKLIVQHDEEPDIGIVLEYDEVVKDWVGECTECGYLAMGRRETAVTEAKAHIDGHVL